MHESSLIADLMKKTYAIAHRENAERIVSVRVQLGLFVARTARQTI